MVGRAVGSVLRLPAGERVPAPLQPDARGRQEAIFECAAQGVQDVRGEWARGERTCDKRAWNEWAFVEWPRAKDEAAHRDSRVPRSHGTERIRDLSGLFPRRR